MIPPVRNAAPPYEPGPRSVAWSERYRELVYLHKGPDNSNFETTLYVLITRIAGRLSGQTPS